MVIVTAMRTVMMRIPTVNGPMVGEPAHVTHPTNHMINNVTKVNITLLHPWDLIAITRYKISYSSLIGNTNYILSDGHVILSSSLFSA